MTAICMHAVCGWRTLACGTRIERGCVFRINHALYYRSDNSHNPTNSYCQVADPLLQPDSSALEAEETVAKQNDLKIVVESNFKVEQSSTSAKAFSHLNVLVVCARTP